MKIYPLGLSGWQGRQCHPRVGNHFFVARGLDLLALAYPSQDLKVCLILVEYFLIRDVPIQAKRVVEVLRFHKEKAFFLHLSELGGV